MDPSSAQQHHQATRLEDVIDCNKQNQGKKLIRPEHLKCPRCDSSNTKFCYYNNYSLSQPRYFCKACRRYWTKGGSLRNVPVGGGCRKNTKRCPSSSSSSSKRSSQDQFLCISNSNSNNPNPLPISFPSLSYDSSDLTLAFGGLINKQPPTRQLRLDDHDASFFGNPNANTGFLGFLDAPPPTTAFHNFYYGYGNGNMGEVDQVGGHEEIVLPYEDMSGGAGGGGSTTATAATTITTTKQEFYNGREGENRMFMNFPWLGGEGGNVDSGRESWNGIGSSWPGLINSSLM